MKPAQFGSVARAWSHAVTATADAYSFSYYGAKSWAACFGELYRRGYNSTEASAIMRSVIARYAADARLTPDDHATPADLARFLDGPGTWDGGTLQSFVDDCVVGINAPILWLAYSRPQNAPRALSAAGEVRS